MTKNEIEDIRNIPITRLLSMPSSGRRFAIRCPFHRERSASCIIYPDNTFHCFGCSAHGNGAIDFVMKMGSSFKEAVEELRHYL